MGCCEIIHTVRVLVNKRVRSVINKGIWKTCLLQAAGHLTGLAVLGYPISFGQIPADFPLLPAYRLYTPQ